MWASPQTADNTYAVMLLLALGTLVNMVVTVPYTLAIATGHSRIPLLVNIYGLVGYLPVLYFLVVNGGIIGAGLAWVAQNVYYMVVMIPWI